MKKNLIISGILLIIVLAAVFAVKHFYQPPAEEPYDIAWRSNFDTAAVSSTPEGWKIKGKPGTPLTVFKIEKGGEKGESVLHMEADKATGCLITLAKDVDLEKTPFLSWRWKANTLPAGADGRDKKKDDQAISIYVGDGSLFNNKSVSYRWDTETPDGSEGNATYGVGTVKVKWITLKNKKDKTGVWFTERRNCLEDFKKAWGTVPQKVYISVASNSQYTGTAASADLEWIELSSAPVKK